MHAATKGATAYDMPKREIDDGSAELQSACDNVKAAFSKP